MFITSTGIENGKISGDEKVGQKRSNKEKISRIVSSSDSESKEEVVI